MNNEALYDSDPTSFRVVEMLENIPDNFLSVNSNWKITYLNKACERLYQVNRWDLMGKNLWELFPDSLQQGFNYYKHFTYSLQQQVPVEFEEYSPTAQIWLYLKTYTITGGLAIYSRDITAEKELRDRARSDAMNLAILIDHSEDMIWSVDTELKMLFGNKAFRNCFQEFAGFYPAEGQHLLEGSMAPGMRHNWQESYTRVLQGEAFMLTENWVQENDTRYMEINFNPIYTSNGDVRGVNCFVKDVTSNYQSANRIRTKNDQLKKIAWMQSHKMRCPVANLLGIVELMKVDFPERMTGDSLMNALYNSVVQIDEITREIVLATKELEL